MKRRPLSEINTGSMADIAFLLLIFFLVTTTMSTNTGLQRRLPPVKDTTEMPVIVRNVMLVLINRENVVAVNGEPVLISDLCSKAKEFFLNSKDSPNLPEKKEKLIPVLGKFWVSKGVISLQTDRTTKYSRYLEVQNELVKAVNELRDDLATDRFKMPFEDLSEEKQRAISAAFPLAISEAEPRMMTTAGNY